MLSCIHVISYSEIFPSTFFPFCTLAGRGNLSLIHSLKHVSLKMQICFPLKTASYAPMFQTVLLLETGTATFTTVSYTPWLSKHGTVLIQCGPAPSDYLCIPEASAKWGSFTLLKHLSFALLQQLYLSLRKKEGPTWLMEWSMQVRSQKWCEKYSRHFLALTFSGCLVGLMLQRVVMVKWMQNETTQSTTSWTVYREQSKQKNQGRAAWYKWSSEVMLPHGPAEWGFVMQWVGPTQLNKTHPGNNSKGRITVRLGMEYCFYTLKRESQTYDHYHE